MTSRRDASCAWADARRAEGWRHPLAEEMQPTRVHTRWRIASEISFGIVPEGWPDGGEIASVLFRGNRMLLGFYADEATLEITVREFYRVELALPTCMLNEWHQVGAELPTPTPEPSPRVYPEHLATIARLALGESRELVEDLDQARDALGDHLLTVETLGTVLGRRENETVVDAARRVATERKDRGDALYHLMKTPFDALAEIRTALGLSANAAPSVIVSTAEYMSDAAAFLLDGPHVTEAFEAWRAGGKKPRS